jgi:hypothetical protein
VARELDRASAGRQVAGALIHAGSSLLARLGKAVRLSGSVRARRRLAGMVAGFCAVMIGAGLWEVRTILESGTAQAIPAPVVVPRRTSESPVSAAAPKALASNPASAETAAADVSREAGPVRPPSLPPPSGVRRPALKARPSAGDPVPRRPAHALVEMDGLVDL